MNKKKKEKYYILTQEDKKYYTTDIKLVHMRDLYYKWNNLQGLAPMLFILGFVIGIGPICVLENRVKFTWWCWVLTIIAILTAISAIVLGCIRCSKDKKYAKYEDLFFKTKEYSAQYNKYKKLERDRREKELKEKATDLVESYDILEDNQMPKEVKIDLLKSYIERSEKRK